MSAEERSSTEGSRTETTRPHFSRFEKHSKNRNQVSWTSGEILIFELFRLIEEQHFKVVIILEDGPCPDAQESPIRPKWSYAVLILGITQFRSGKYFHHRRGAQFFKKARPASTSNGCQIFVPLLDLLCTRLQKAQERYGTVHSLPRSGEARRLRQGRTGTAASSIQPCVFF